MSEKESFEAALRSLEEAVEKLEEGELSLEDSLACFEQGVQNAARCRRLLQAVESRVEVLLKDRDGNFSTEDFQES